MALETLQIQQYTNFIYWIFSAVIGIIILLVILYKIYIRMSYTYHVFLHKKIGDTNIIINDDAKQVNRNNNYFLHLRKVNKYAPANDAEGNHFTTYCSFYKTSMLGIFPSSKLAIHIFLDGITPFFLKVQKNPGLYPVRIDSINWVQNHVLSTIRKYEKTNQLMQLLPYLAVGGIIMMFIVGMIFYTKHIENISAQILGAAKSQAQLIAEQGAQVLKPG